MSSVKTYSDLLVWQKGIDLVTEIYKLMRKMPDDERFALTSQIKRSCVSIPSNIAEGWGRDNQGSFLQHLRIGNGSLCELETQLLIVEKLEYIGSSEIDEIRNKTNELGKMLRSLMKSVEKNK
jgi:four helix bundle protein